MGRDMVLDDAVVVDDTFLVLQERVSVRLSYDRTASTNMDKRIPSVALTFHVLFSNTNRLIAHEHEDHHEQHSSRYKTDI